MVLISYGNKNDCTYSSDVSRQVLVLCWLEQLERQETGVKTVGSVKRKENFLLVMLQPKVTVTFTLAVKAKKLFWTHTFLPICRLPWKEYTYQRLGFRSCAGKALFGPAMWAKMDEQTRKHNCENLLLMSLFSTVFYSQNKSCKYLGAYSVSLAVSIWVIYTGFTH